MGLLEGKNALIFGLANQRSIAWGITQAFHREGANIGISYAGEALKRRVDPLAEEILRGQYAGDCDLIIGAEEEKLTFTFNDNRESKQEKVAK